MSASLVSDLIVAQCARTPHAVAITFAGRGYSYAELNAASDRVAASVRAALVDTRDVLVGVCVDRSFAMVATLLGVMKAGAAYLPLDPDLPAARLRLIVEDARPALLVTGAAFRGDPAFQALPALIVEAVLDGGGEARAEPAPPCDGSDRLAYVIYTSGSTGRPKGVEVEHASVLSLIAAFARSPGFTPEDVLLAVARVSFDVSVVELFLPLACGGRVVLADKATASDSRRLADLIATSGATVMDATPATWRTLIATGWRGSDRLRIWSGGEALTRDLADALLPRCRELWNVYGPTETTVCSTVHRVEPDGEVAIGGPIAGTNVHVLNEALRPVAAGETGELCIAGAGLTRGYRGRPELTAERFPTLAGGERIYRTGDLARLGPQGELVYAGRIDDQVKIRGHRVEMGEVEAVLSRHPAVQACAVRCWTDAIGENALAAYVVMQGGTDPAGARLGEHLRQALPAYMLPQQVVALATLPLTPNGKVDRNGLPRPARAAAATPPPAPRTHERDEIRSGLSGVWSDLLGCSEVGDDDDFFDLGGYSLLTVHLQLRIHDRFGADLSLPDLFAASTLSAMVDAIRSGAPCGTWRAIPLRPQGDELPLYWLDGGPLIRTVVREMRTGRPVLGVNLTPQEERELDRPGVGVAEIARYAARRMGAVAPTGPLHLGGWCRWGVVAYETARLLREEGREVHALLLLDAECGSAGLSVRERISRLRASARTVLRPAPARPDGFGQRVDEAAARYVGKPYDGPVSLFLPENMGGRRSRDGGWGRYADQLRVFTTPGDHVSMVRQPHACSLAGAFDRALYDGTQDGAAPAGGTADASRAVRFGPDGTRTAPAAGS